MESVKVCKDFVTRSVLGHGYVNFKPTFFNAGENAGQPMTLQDEAIAS